MFCVKCGKRLKENTEFCPFCGANLQMYISHEAQESIPEPAEIHADAEDVQAGKEEMRAGEDSLRSGREETPPDKSQEGARQNAAPAGPLRKNGLGFPKWLIYTLGAMTLAAIIIIVALIPAFQTNQANRSPSVSSPGYTSPARPSTGTAPYTYTPPATASTVPSVTSPTGTTAKQTVFNTALLKNWTDKALASRYGSSGSFQPSNPKPMHYIVQCNTVMDPVTHSVSKGGRSAFSARHLPIDTDDVMQNSGNLRNAGLILTDDPNQATYLLELNFTYSPGRTFTFSDKSSVTQYQGTLNAVLKNLTTGQSIRCNSKKTYATYTGESVQQSMLNAAKGKQMYAGAPSLYLSDFPDNSSFFK